MRKLIIFVSLLILIAAVTPALALATTDAGSSIGQMTVSAPSGMAIVGITFVSNEGTTGQISFLYNDGSAQTGSWSYIKSDSFFGVLPLKTGEITLGSDSESQGYITDGRLYTMFSQSGNNYNLTGSTRMLGAIGQNPILTGFSGGGPMVYADCPAVPIIEISFNTDSNVEYTVYEESYTSINDALKSSEEDWIRKIMDLIYGVFTLAWDFIYSLIYWLKFFFVDNLLMIVALFLAVPMAFAAKNSKGNPEKFLRQYFKSLKGFFEFLLSIWKMLIETIGTVRGWFRI